MQQRRSDGLGRVGDLRRVHHDPVGIFDIIDGLVAIFDDDFVIAVQGGRDDNLYLIKDDHVGLGRPHHRRDHAARRPRGAPRRRCGAGRSACHGELQAIAHLATIDSHPWWSLIVIILDVLVIYGLVVHGGELREEY